MGHHYLPKYYLRGFSHDLGKDIWVYDKKDSREFSTQVKSIANVCNLYSPELENFLSISVEEPANKVLDKIRTKTQLDEKDKVALSEYITVLWKRVPKGKERLKQRAPEVTHQLRKQYHENLDLIIKQEPEKESLAEKRRVEIDHILDEYSKKPPDDVWHKIIPAESTPQMVSAITTMTWCFFVSEEKPAFLTCDNPVFFFPGMGVGNKDSELSFPITSHISLWATRRTDISEGYIPTNKNVIKEMNRRVAFNTSRYVFHTIKEEWILPFIKKKKWSLTRIV